MTNPMNLITIQVLLLLINVNGRPADEIFYISLNSEVVYVI